MPLLYNNPKDRSYFRAHSKHCKQCMICGRDTRKLVIDHNHQNREIRGLLCGQCNTGLGMFCDSPSILEAAVTYLRGNGFGPFERKARPIIVKQNEILVKERRKIRPHNKELALDCVRLFGATSQREASRQYAATHGCTVNAAQTYVNRVVNGFYE